MNKLTETAEALVIANRVLDQPHADPDSDVCILARQLQRSLETVAAMQLELKKSQKKVDDELKPGILHMGNTSLFGTGLGKVLIDTGPLVDAHHITGLRVFPLGTNVKTTIQLFVNNGLNSEDPANNIRYHSFIVQAHTESVHILHTVTSFPTPGLYLKGGVRPYRLFATTINTLAKGLVINPIRR